MHGLVAYESESDDSSTGPPPPSFSQTAGYWDEWLSFVFVKVLDAALEAPVTAVSRDELHISLTRPTLLRKYDHESYVKCVAAALSRTSPFMVSFSHVECFPSDSSNRVFLGFVVGAGSNEDAFHAPHYYGEARFHSSFAYTAQGANQDDRENTPTIPSTFVRNTGHAIAERIEQHAGEKLRRAPPIHVRRVGIKCGNDINWVPMI